MEIRGVDYDKTVVFYQENSGFRAARGFWFLEYLGHEDAHVLDGGVDAWKAGGLPVTREAWPMAGGPYEAGVQGHRRILRTSFASRLKPYEEGRIATADYILNHLGDPDVAIHDTRSEGEYFAENVRAARGGAVPGSVHLEWTEAIAEDGSLKPASELVELLEPRGLTPEKEMAPLCRAATARRTPISSTGCSAILGSGTISVPGKSGATGQICPSKSPGEARRTGTGRERFTRALGFRFRVLRGSAASQHAHDTCESIPATGGIQKIEMARIMKNSVPRTGISNTKVRTGPIIADAVSRVTIGPKPAPPFSSPATIGYRTKGAPMGNMNPATQPMRMPRQPERSESQVCRISFGRTSAMSAPMSMPIMSLGKISRMRFPARPTEPQGVPRFSDTPKTSGPPLWSKEKERSCRKCRTCFFPHKEREPQNDMKWNCSAGTASIAPIGWMDVAHPA